MPRFNYIVHKAYTLAIMCLVCMGCGQAISGQRGDDLRGVAIAEVNGETIMSETFREGYVSYLLKTGLQDKPEYRRHFLNSQVASLLLVQEARKEGVESQKDYKEAFARIHRKLLIDIYVGKALFGTIEVSDDELKDMFVRANTTLTARHLYAPTAKDAEVLFGRLQDGATFEELAKEVFADSVLARNGGLIGEFTIDDMDVAFEEAAYQLEVGEVSEPVRTANGYSIIKLEDRFTKPLITEYEYAESKDRILQFVLFRKKTKLRKEHAAQLLKELSPRYNEAALSQLYDVVVGSTTVQNDEALQSLMGQWLVSFNSVDGEKTWTMQDFQGFASETNDKQRSRVRTEEDVQTFIEGLLVREEMAVRSQAQQLDEDPEFEYEVEKAMHNWIWSRAVNQLKSEGAVSKDSLEAYYAANSDNFLPQSAVEVFEILVDSKDAALEVAERLKTDSFESVAQAYSMRPGAQNHGGRLGYLVPKQLGVLWQHVEDAKEGDRLGPIELDDHYVFLKIGGRKLSRDSQQPNLDEIRAQYLLQHGDRMVLDRVDALKASSNISINEAVLSTLEINKPYSLTD